MSPTTYRVLGPLAVDRDGETLALGGPKQRTVLAALLLEPGRVVPADRLAALVWGDPPDHAASTLQVYVSNLRRVLRGTDEPLQRVRPGYRLEVDPADVDLGRAGELREQARHRRTSGEAAAAANLLRLALAQWRGPALADLRQAPQVEVLVTGIDRMRAGMLRELYELELELGRHRQVLDELETAVAADPYDEVLATLLALACYRSGRQHDALAALRRTASRLADDLGIDPSPALRELETAVLRQDPSLDLLAAGDLSATRQREDRGLRGATLTLPGGAVVELQARTWVIGRHPSCEIVLADPECSRRHAEIRPVRGGYQLVDLGSTNGTRVGGAEVREHPLHDGDRVEIGSTALRFATAH